MTIICRTCLTRCHIGYNVNDRVDTVGNGSVRISTLLNICVPEVFLSVSTNPKVCFDCKETIKQCYNFKKTCMNVEALISTYIKCTGYKKTNERPIISLTKIQQFREARLQEIQSDDKSKNSPTDVSKTPEKKTETVSPQKKVEKNRIIVVVKKKKEAENLTKDTLQKIVQTNEIQNSKSKIQTKLRTYAKNQLIKKDESKEKVNLDENSGKQIESKLDEKNQEEIIKKCNEKIKNKTNSPNIKLCPKRGIFLNEKGDPISYRSPNSNEKEKSASETPIKTSNSKKLAENCTTLPTIKQEAPEHEKNSSLSVSIPENLIRVKTEPQDEEIPNSVDTNPLFSMQIKSEPLDINDCSPNLQSTDEGTLSAPESSEQMEKSLKGILDSIPIDNDQYYDVPDLVQIKFTDGGSEMSDRVNYDLQPINTPACPILPFNQGQGEDLKEVALKPKNKQRKNIFKKNPKSKLLLLSQKDVMMLKNNGFVVKQNRKLVGPIINGGIRIINESKEVNTKDLGKGKSPFSTVKNDISKAMTTNVVGNLAVGVNVQSKNGGIMEKKTELPAILNPYVKKKPIMQTPKKRRKRRIKIVPVNDCDPEQTIPKETNKKNYPGEVVMLYTSYCPDGTYINDHDYLINPYKRNGVLIQENDTWYCRCYICDTKHYSNVHERHMKNHLSTRCKVCNLDLETPYMLNLHAKQHYQPCKVCRQNITYPLHEQHAHPEAVKIKKEKKECPPKKKRKSDRGWSPKTNFGEDDENVSVKKEVLTKTEAESDKEVRRSSRLRMLLAAPSKRSASSEAPEEDAGPS